VISGPEVNLLLDLETVIEYDVEVISVGKACNGGLDNVAEVCRYLVDCSLFLTIVRMIRECVCHWTNENTMNLDLCSPYSNFSEHLISN